MHNHKKIKPTTIPLVTVDPYFNIWSMSDKLTDDFTRHWTGKRNAMTGLLKIDGQMYSFLGTPETDVWDYLIWPPAKLEQTNLEVLPLKTVARLENELISLDLTFRTPLLCDDLYLMSRPVSYISYAITAKDGKEHEIEVYFDISAEAAVNTPDQTVTFSRGEKSIYCGRGEEGMLTKSGDNMRIDWGYLHMFGVGFDMHALDYAARRECVCGKEIKEVRELPDNVTMQVGYKPPVIALTKKYTLKEGYVSDFLCVGYDDIHSVEYLGKQVDAYWKKDGATFDEIIDKAIAEYDDIVKRCDKFDKELIERAEKISDKYADILSVAYRQTIAAHKLVWDGEKLLFLSKECSSNGCIGTVDVTYPSIPMFLVYNPELVAGMLHHVFEYAASQQWNYDFAPHDIGQYPLANGQFYGYTPKLRIIEDKWQMPVEECGNMILCVAAYCYRIGSADYAKKHEAILAKWAEYLVENGYNPENQLCTDDFAGHLAHNCNLSVKAIMGIAAWGMLLNMMGIADEAEKYTAKAKELAAKWKKEAFDGDHYRLTFDTEGTWSLKYNMVWDKLLKLGIFDEDIFETETKYYMTKLNKYGVPLDSRKDYTKSDWEMWSTVLFGGEYTEKVIEGIWNMLCDTKDRFPFADWYDTVTANNSGFWNRTVQGGLFINILKEELK